MTILDPASMRSTSRQELFAKVVQLRHNRIAAANKQEVVRTPHVAVGSSSYFFLSQSKPDTPLVFEILLVERQAYLQFGYIASGAATVATQLPLPTSKVTPKALGDKDLVLAANDTPD